MRNAIVRGARTAIQTFAGTLAGVQVTLDVTFARTVASAAIGAGVAGLLAFGMNLPGAEALGAKLQGRDR